MKYQRGSDFDFSINLSANHPVLRHHSVHGKPLVPGVTWLNIIIQALTSLNIEPDSVALENILFREPLSLTGNEQRHISLAYDTDSKRLTVSSLEGSVQHCQCNIDWYAHLQSHSRADEQSLSVQILKQNGQHRPLQSVYANAKRLAIEHGDWMQGVGDAWLSDDAVVAEIALSQHAMTNHHNYPLHPALLDCATLVPFAAGGFGIDPDIPFIPLAIQRLRVFSTGFHTATVLTQLSPGVTHNLDILHHDLLLLTDSGEPLLEVSRLSAKRIRTESTLASGNDLHIAELESLQPQPTPDMAAAVVEQNPLSPSCGDTTADVMMNWVSEFIQRHGHLAEIPEAETGFYELGLDSTTLLNLSAELETELGRTFYPTLCYEYGTVVALSKFLHAEKVALPSTLAAPAAPAAPAENTTSETPERDNDAARISSHDAVSESAVSRLDAIRNDASKTSSVAAVQWLIPDWVDAPAQDVQLNSNGWYFINADTVRLASAWQLESDCQGLIWTPTAQDDLSALLAESIDVARQLVSSKAPLKLLVMLRSEYSGSALVPFLRSVVCENPRLCVRVVSGEHVDPDVELGFDHPGVEWIAYHQSASATCRRVKQVLRAGIQSYGADAPSLDAVIITGGLGAIGQHLLNTLVESGHRKFSLWGRRAPSEEQLFHLKALQAQHVEVQCLQVDVCEESALTRAWRQTKDRFGSVGGILHCAGSVNDGLIAQKDTQKATTLLDVKYHSARMLDTLSANEPLSFFAVCGSMTGVLGNLGQADYAFSNGALQAFSRARSRELASGLRSGVSVCINWPFWQDGGMHISAKRQQQLASETGLLAMDTRTAHSVWWSALAGQCTSCLPLCVMDQAHSVFEKWTASTGLSVFRQTPTIPAATMDVSSDNATPSAQGPEAIAVIGLAGEYPGAEDIQHLWDNLVQSRDSVSAVPPSRWDHAALFDEQRGKPGSVYCGEGGFIAKHDYFDAGFFRITPAEAQMMDPQERRFLQIAWQSVEHAGMNPSSLESVRVGVYVGTMWGQYQLMGQDKSGKQASSIHAAIANRVSYSLNLTGPSLAVDSMCSSSLSAIHLAMEALRRGECHMAIAGGVNLMYHSHKYQFLCQNQMLSDDGRCRSFGEGGSGYVPGEGVGAVVLKPYSQALADGDPVHALLIGSALNHSGHGAGMTVPNPAAQARVIRQAHEQAGTLSQVSYIEAHGTGTSLGDPIEIEGLRQAFSGTDTDAVSIGSIKSNIGHLEGAAGIAALSKVVLQLQHQTLVSSLHSAALNPELLLDDTPFVVQQRTEQWNAERRVAGISAFGAGGSNAHLVVAEAPQTPYTNDATAANVVLPISAQDMDSLMRYVKKWRDYIMDPAHEQFPLSAIAHTAQHGRNAFALRIAVVASSHQQVFAALDRWLSDAEWPVGVVLTETSTTDKKEVNELARHFVSGSAVNWPKIHSQKVTIPVYPFLGSQYWIDTANKQWADPLLHSLLSSIDSLSYQSHWNEQEILLQQHCIQGRTLMPAAMMLETVRAGLQKHQPASRCTLESARIGAPCAIEGDTAVTVELFHHGDSVVAELVSSTSDTICMQAVTQVAVGAAVQVELPGDDHFKPVDELYPQFAQRGLSYGRDYQTLTGVCESASGIWVKLALPECSTWRARILAIDAAMQSVALCTNDLARDESIWLPHQLRHVSWLAELSDARFAHAEVMSMGEKRRRYRLALYDADGNTVWSADEFELKVRWHAVSRPVIEDSIGVELSAVDQSLGAVQSVMDVSKNIECPALSVKGSQDTEELVHAVRSFLSDLLAVESGLNSSVVRSTDSFTELGVDSVMVMNMTFKLEKTLGDLPKSMFFEHAGIRALAVWLVSEHGAAIARQLGFSSAEDDALSLKTPQCDSDSGDTLQRAQGSSSEIRTLKSSQPAVSSEHLAVIGMAGRFPDAENIDQLWQNLVDGHDAVTEIPEDRWPWELFYQQDGKSGNYCRHGSFIKDAECFDADFFGMTPADARLADPQERLFLETAWHTVENAGYSKKLLNNKPIGVFAASMWQQYQHYGADAALRGEQPATYSLLSSIANRISYMLGVTGPSVALDTMCSGSMTALHLASQSIARGDCEAALVGGVNLSVHPLKYLTLSQGGFLSETGRCSAFGLEADGYVPGEGAACIMVKPLSKALADGDPVHGVIRATAINHVGTSNGSTVPSPVAQANVIVKALERAGLSADSIGYVEAHGTGTALGDPIELEGLNRALNADGRHPGCFLGSIKSNLGHMEAAAGITGILKVLLQFRHRTLVPTLHVGQKNPILDLDAKPFTLVEHVTPMGDGVLPCAAVSAFGAGGSNAHTILQAFDDSRVGQTDGAATVTTNSAITAELFVLSARSTEQVRLHCQALADWMEQHPDASLSALAATLLLGRDEQSCRLALVTDKRRTLLESLRLFASEGVAGKIITYKEHVITGEVNELFDDTDGRDYVHLLMQQRRLDKLVRLWLNGVRLDWTPLFPAGQLRLSLPGYAFKRVLHKVDHELDSYALSFSNESDLYEQRYRVSMPGWHKLIAHHQIDNERRVSLALMANLVQKAIVEAAGDAAWAVELEVKQPWIIDKRLEADIVLEPVGSGIDLQLRKGELLIATGHARIKTFSPVALGVPAAHWESAQSFYQRFADQGYCYGASYQGVAEFALLDKQVVARLNNTTPLSGVDWQFHPGVLDAGLQLTRELLDTGESSSWLPVSVSLHTHAQDDRPDRPGCAWVMIEQVDRNDSQARFVVRWLDSEQVLLARSELVMMCRQTATELQKTLLVTRQWIPAPEHSCSEVSESTEVLTVGNLQSVTGDALSFHSLSELLVEEKGAAQSSMNVIQYIDSTVSSDELFWSYWQFIRACKSAGLRNLSLVVQAQALSPSLQALAVWFRAMGEEIPNYRCRVVLVDKQRPVDQLLAECRQEQTLVRLTDQGRECFALADLQDVSTLPTADLSDQVVLITGGAGGLGYLFARYLASTYKVHPILVGRRKVDDSILRQVNTLKRLGVEATYFSVDTSKSDDCQLLRRKIQLRYGRLDGVIHAAGVSNDAWLVDQEAESVAKVLAPKVTGTDNLLELVRPFAPQWVASFGSISGFLGNPGQTDYSYANAYMDASLATLAGSRTRVLSLSWPLWKDTGMQVDPKMLNVMRQRYGMEPLPPATGLTLFEKLLSAEHSQVLTLFGDPSRLRHWLASREPGLDTEAALSDVSVVAAQSNRQWLGDAASNSESEQQSVAAEHPVTAKVKTVRPTVANVTTVAANPSAGDAASATIDPLAMIRLWLASAIEAETQIPSDQLDWHRPIDQFGISSVVSTSIVARLEEQVGSLPATLLFECQSWTEVAEYVRANTKYAAMTAPSGAPTTQSDVSAAQEAESQGKLSVPRKLARSGDFRFGRRGGDLAIIGAACRFPGADNLQAYWGLLSQGEDAVSPIPQDRWDWKQFTDADNVQAMQGGFVQGIDQFDYPFFGLSLGEAQAMDPQERLILQTTWHSLEDAGLAPASLSGQAVGVYMGAMWNQYQMLALDSWQQNPATVASNGSMASIANRLSFLMNLTGPSLTLDTMCSSSLTCLKLASDALRSGEIDVALVGGVNLSVHPFKYQQLLQSQFLSPEGRCGAFGEGGDGYVPGEGVGVIVLRRADDAREHGDRIRALVKGIGINHGGRSNGFYVPRPQAQAAAINRALEDGDIDPQSVSYIEAHGTGTRLGDPIEITGIKMSYVAEQAMQCSIGSVKANIGHCESAAGMASICKVLLQMEHGKLAPSIHADPPNPDLGLEGTGLTVQTALTDWVPQSQAQKKLRAGISAFGAGGVNAHVILEAPASSPSTNSLEVTDDLRAEVIVLSGNTEAGLRSLVDLYCNQLQQQQVSLHAVAAATQLGRNALDYRLAIVANSLNDLLRTLQQWLAGTETGSTWFNRVVQGGALHNSAASLSDRLGAETLAQAWVQGERIDWSVYWPSDMPRILLPNYPFTAMKVWLSHGRNVVAAQATRSAAITDQTQEAALLGGSLQQQALSLEEHSTRGRSPQALPVKGNSDQTVRVLAQASVSDKLVQVMAMVFGLEPDAIDTRLTFDRLGMESVAAHDCAVQLNSEYGIEIDPTWFFNFPTIDQLSRAIADETAVSVVAAEPDSNSLPAAALENDGFEEGPDGANKDLIAVVGMSGAFAGATDLDEYWRNLMAGVNSVSEVDSERWSIDAYHSEEAGMPGKTVSRRMGQLQGIDRFDPAAFNLMPAEVEAMDPQQRLFLKHAVIALDHAGIPRERIDNTQCGVFAGAMTGSYRNLMGTSDLAMSAFAMLGNHSAALPARVAYWLNLHGPTLVVDTACSSSLVAVHLACRSIQQGECDSAIAGGVFVSPGPEEMVSSSQAGMLSAGGQCKSFDDSADGIALGEGVGVVVLKSLHQALADGDAVQAIIRASGINQDGTTNGLTAPNALSQARLISAVVREAGLHTDELDYLECHGTGTRLGDPVEVEGIRRSLSGTRSTPLLVGSVKPNIGHCYAAAGIASLLKVILSLQARKLAPSIGFAQPNTLIDFDNANVTVNKMLTPWRDTAVKRCGVSAFGYSGTNAHLIVEEAPRFSRQVADTTVCLPLSARKPALVIDQAHRLAEWLAVHPQALLDISHTLKTGRTAESCRAALVCSTLDEAIQALQLLDEEAVKRVPRDAIVQLDNTVYTDPQAEANSWMAGGHPWLTLQVCPLGSQRIPMPGKCFDEKRYWVSATEQTVEIESNPVSGPVSAVNKLIPMSAAAFKQAA